MNVIIYCDESKSESKNLCSICAISLEKKDLENHIKALEEILKKYSVKELKFEEIRTHTPKIECAKEFINFAIENASKGKLRIDVLLWNLLDSRHSIPRRDNKKNLEIMYFNILRHVAGKWRSRYQDVIFGFYPDENTEYSFQKIVEYLRNTKYRHRRKPSLLRLFDENSVNFSFEDLEEKKSHQEPLIQLSDLLAGIACFSRENANEYKMWSINEENKDKQELPFPEDGKRTEYKINKTQANRFGLIKLIKEHCKKRKITVSLETKCYLRTDPFYKNQPINFWHYEPQGTYDVAPTKEKK